MVHRLKLIPKMLKGKALKKAEDLLHRIREVQWDLEKTDRNENYVKSRLVRDAKGNVSAIDVNTAYRLGIPEYKYLTRDLYNELMRQLEYLRIKERKLGQGINDASRTISEILSHEIDIDHLHTKEEIEEAAKILAVALGSAAIGAGGYYVYDKYNNNNDSYDNYVELRPDEDFGATNFENWQDWSK